MKAVLAWLGRAALVTAAYYVAARIALLMAIPPGYATAVWPAAGISLVAVLTLGRPAAAGVFLGSFLVNVGTALAAGGADLQAIAVAASIGAGAAVQAVVGAGLVRRVVGYPGGLERDGDVARFLVAAGPVASTVAATWGVASLYVAGIVPRSAVAFNWWTWWVGDTIGVVLFAPLLLCFVGQPAESWRRRRVLVALPLAVGFAAITALFVRASAWERDEDRAEFERRAAVVGRALERQAERSLDVGVLVANLFDAGIEFGPRRFERFASRATAPHPGIHGLSWIRRVAGADRAGYEAARRAAGDGADRDFAIRDLRDGRLVPAPARAEYFPVHFIGPAAENRMTLGFDVASDPVRRAALERCRDTGQPTATPPLVLVQDPAHIGAFLLLVPVYAGDEEPTTVDARRASLAGFSSTVYRAGDIAEVGLDQIDRAGLHVGIYDDAIAGPAGVLYQDSFLAGGGRPWVKHYDVAGRSWRIEVRQTATALLATRSWQAWMVLAGGLCFVSVLGAVLLIVSGREVRIEQLERDQRLEVALSDRGRAARDIDELMQAVATGIVDHLGASRCTFVDVDQAADRVTVRVDHHRGVPGLVGSSYVEGLRPSQSESLRRGQTAVFDDLRHDPRSASAYDAIFAPVGMRGLIAVPLVVEERWIGLLWVSDHEPRHWQPREVRLVRSIAERTWLWIDQLRMVGRLRELNQELEARVVDRTRALATSLHEKDILLREIHHRVKNNLQVISSLLTLQAHGSRAPELQRALDESRDRIQSMALVHDQLYRSSNAAVIDLAAYGSDLLRSIERSHGRAEAVQVRFESAPCTLPLDQAVPCGLIINELVTNALKHGYPGDRTGTVTVTIARPAPDDLVITVRDDGVGLPPGFSSAAATGLGMVIVETLVAQLGASLSVTSDGGASFALRIPLHEPTPARA